MTGKDLIRIIKEHNLEDKTIMLNDIPEDNYGCIIFLLKDDECPEVGIIDFEEPYFTDHYEEYSTGQYWDRNSLVPTYSTQNVNK